MAKKQKPAFSEMMEQSMTVRGVSNGTAISEAQDRYESFMKQYSDSIGEQDSRSNSASTQLTSHFALLSTLSLTVVGFLFRAASNLTTPHKWIIVCILVSQTISLTFGAIDYIVTIKFHRAWAAAYKKVTEKANELIDSGEIQLYSDLTSIEPRVVKDLKLPLTTPIVIPIIMVLACISGLLLLILLFSAYLFDIPFWNN